MLTRLLVTCMAAAAAVASAACDKVPLLAPSGSTVALSATTTVLPPGGSTPITATVIEAAGTPVHDGTLVRFSASLGTVDPPEVETRGGIATTTFTAGSASGTAQIRATSGSASGGTGEAPSNLVEILVGGAAANSVAVTASPSRVPSSGGTVTIIASALDASGNRLIGVPITFSTTAGTLSAGVASTDSNGEARVSLTTSREATVTARAGSQSAPTTVEVGEAPTFTLVATPSNPVAGAPVTLTITPAAQTSPRVVVSWGDGTSDDLGRIAGVRSVTHIYQRSGSYSISATATEDGDSFTNSTAVNVGSATVSIGDPVPATPTAGTPVTFTVTPLAGTSPRVVMDWGDGDTTDIGTVAAARTVPHTYGSAGTYVVTATATSGADTFTTSRVVTVSAPAAVSVTVSGSPANPNRCQPVTFTATTTGTTVSSYRWSIDSNVDAEDAEITTSGSTLTRAFENSGTKTVTVTATSTDGRTGNAQTQVVVGTTSSC